MMTSEGPLTSSVRGAVATAATRSAGDRPASGPSTAVHGPTYSPSGKLVQKMIPSAHCDPTVDLLSEKACRSHPGGDDEPNVNRTSPTIASASGTGGSGAAAGRVAPAVASSSTAVVGGAATGGSSHCRGQFPTVTNTR